MSSAWVYDAAVADYARGELDWERDDLRVSLVSERYEPSQSNHSTVDDLPSHRNAVSLGGRDVVRGEAAGETILTASSVTWPSFTGSFRYAIVWRADDGRLVSCADVGLQTATNARVELDYAPGGITIQNLA